jgi:quinol monooxygenase YgiN
MHIQIVNFNLKDLTPQQFESACDELAPAFAAVPGLLTKVWLADRATNTFGGVYTWRDEAALRAFQETELFRNVIGHPNFANITSREFAVIEAPTRVTRGEPAAAAV